MAWRPTQYLIEGELDNTNPGKVTGWMRFAGLNEKVTFDLEGNFHRDIRGAKIHFTGDAYEDEAEIDGKKYFEGFALHQTGKVGDITAGLPPQDYSDYPYIEWYSEQNGRIVLELEPVQIEVIGKPIPAIESDPISRDEQNKNMAKFLGSLAEELNIPSERAICLGGKQVIEADKKAANNKIRGMKLLTDEIRKQLPPLYGQDGKGGKAIAYVKFFTPDSNWTWFATEFDGEDTFFGLVEGFEKELGYFSLSELENTRGPLGLPIERDLYWQPKTLQEIAPEMFKDNERGVIDMFKDVQFMTAREKELVLKNWKTFLQHGLKKEHFTKRLYQHLHLHCGFIAHYDIHGFYATYFETGQDTERFFEHFCNYSAQNYGANSDYDDLNTAMRQVYNEFKDSILAKAENDIDDRLNLLETCVKRAKNDREFAKQLLDKVQI